MPLAVTDILNRDTITGNQTAPALKEHDEYLTYVVRDRQGNLLLQSHDANPDIFAELPREGFTNTTTHRIYVASAVNDTLYIEVAEPLARASETVPLFEDLGWDEIEASGRTIRARKYEMRGDLRLTLWYDESGRWVKLVFPFKGSTIEYVMK
mgnify:CR=1 FL=1